MPPNPTDGSDPSLTIDNLVARVEDLMRQNAFLSENVTNLKGQKEALQAALVTADADGRKKALEALIGHRAIKGTAVEQILRDELGRLG